MANAVREPLAFFRRFHVRSGAADSARIARRPVSVIFLLDTNTCISLIKRSPTEVLRKFGEYAVGDIGVSSITVAELYFGAQKSNVRPKTGGRWSSSCFRSTSSTSTTMPPHTGASGLPWRSVICHRPAGYAHCGPHRGSRPDAGNQQRSRVCARAGPQAREPGVR